MIDMYVYIRNGFTMGSMAQHNKRAALATRGAALLPERRMSFVTDTYPYTLLLFLSPVKPEARS